MPSLPEEATPHKINPVDVILASMTFLFVAPDARRSTDHRRLPIQPLISLAKPLRPNTTLASTTPNQESTGAGSTSADLRCSKREASSA
jgi:hypothetical protein